MASKPSTASKNSTTPDPAAPQGRRFATTCLTLAMLAGALLVWLSMLSFHPADPPSDLVYPPPSPVANRAGVVGAYLAWGLHYWVGAGTYAALVLLTAWSGLALLGKRISDLPWRVVGLAMLTVAVSTGVKLQQGTFVGAMVENPAGVLGSGLGEFLAVKFGPTGSWIVVMGLASAGVMLTADTILAGLIRWLHAGWKKRNDVASRFAELRRQSKAEKKALKAQAHEEKLAQAAAAAEVKPRPVAPGVGTAAAKSVEAPASPQPAAVSAAGQYRSDAQAGEEVKESKGLFGRAKKDRPKKPASKSQADSPTPAGSEPADKPPAKPAPARTSSAPVPSIELLEKPQGGYREQAEVQAAQRKLVLQQTLDDFGVEAKVEGYMTGPVITLYEVSLAPGVKVAAVSNLSTDIARSLAVPAVRIVPPRFGKDTIGVEVPNLEKEIVRVRQLMEMSKGVEKMRLPLFLGKDAGGDPITVDLARCPHMLIAGTTGSGKSVCINTIIMSLLMTRTPEQVRFILVDPKMVEMAAFEKLPHLLCPTINDMGKAEDILEWAVTKMDERYEILKEARVKNIDGYNALDEKELYERFGVETEEEKQRIPKVMPSYVIIIDELADLMMTSGKEVENYIIRIAQKARAVGIHLVLATQRPSANVVTGLIKSNMPCRVSFQVASGQESRIVLDQKGAEVLLGQGDMLLLQPGGSQLSRAQGTYIDDGEIRAVVTELEDSGEQVFDSQLLKIQSGAADVDALSERDEMFDQAVEVVLAAQRGSVSLLQRRMSIGYGRASRIIDQMAEAGLLGTHKGSQARECMMTLDEWHEFKANIEADQSGESSLIGEPTSV
jgi:DNA segregation ATPase FtsK/SpoIIIE, S-DNA-T family